VAQLTPLFFSQKQTMLWPDERDLTDVGLNLGITDPGEVKMKRLEDSLATTDSHAAVAAW